MKHLVLLAVLAAFAACSGGGRDPTVQCPSDKNKQMSSAEWRACYGYQDKDPSGGR